MLTLAIANQKGGVSKTTTCLALGSELASRGYQVLMIDTDPQSSLTQWLRMESPGRSIAQVIGGATRGTLAMLDIIKPVADNLSLAPADIELATNEILLPGRYGREGILKQCLAGVSDRFDVCLIDTPPALGLLTANTLAAARGVIVPVLPSAADLRGVRLFLQSVDQARELNPELELLGVVIAQYDPRLISHGQALDEIKSAGLQILGVIPKSVRAQEATGAGVSVTVYDPAGKVSKAYSDLTRRVMRWLKQNQ